MQVLAGGKLGVWGRMTQPILPSGNSCPVLLRAPPFPPLSPVVWKIPLLARDGHVRQAWPIRVFHLPNACDWFRKDK